MLIDLGLDLDIMLPIAVKKASIKLVCKEHPYSITNIDRTEHVHNKGIYNQEIPLVTMRIWNYLERIQFDILLMKHNIILGILWLRKYDSLISWK